MEHIRETLSGIIKDIEKKKTGKNNNLFMLFKKNLENKERGHAKCAVFSRGVLTVNVDSSAWLFRLSLKKEKLLKKLGLRDIRFRIGEVK